MFRECHFDIIYIIDIIKKYFVLKITIEAIKSEVDEVSLQGVEFWSTVCDEEMDLAIELAEVILNK